MNLPELAEAERKVPVIVNRYFTVSLERTSGLTFIHCEIHVPWTSAVRQALAHDWLTFLELHKAPILALHNPDDRKHQKFLKLFGFEFAGSFLAPCGSERHIYTINKGDRPHG